MNETTKNLIIFCSGLQGFLMDNSFIGYRITKEKNNAISSLKNLMEKTMKQHKEGEATELIKQIENKHISVEIIRDFEVIENKKRMGKRSVPVNIETLKTLSEIAMWRVCDDCNYKKKKCKLKTTCKSLNDYDIYAPCQVDRFEKERGFI